MLSLLYPYCSICRPKNPAADCASFSSTSPICGVFSCEKNTTEPMVSPSEIIGTTTPAVYFSLPSNTLIFLRSPPRITKVALSSITFSISALIFFSVISRLGTPDTAMMLSLSVMQVGWPLVFDRVSAYSAAKSPSSPMGEYFLKMTSPSRSV